MKAMQGGIPDFQKREALNCPGVFPVIDMATITTGFAGCRAGRGHPKMLTFHNISQHFREIDARLWRIPGNSEIEPAGVASPR
jgi:hypothetical protein